MRFVRHPTRGDPDPLLVDEDSIRGSLREAESVRERG
jgi:hypothetical protein